MRRSDELSWRKLKKIFFSLRRRHTDKNCSMMVFLCHLPYSSHLRRDSLLLLPKTLNVCTNIKHFILFLYRWGMFGNFSEETTRFDCCSDDNCWRLTVCEADRSWKRKFIWKKLKRRESVEAADDEQRLDRENSRSWREEKTGSKKRSTSTKNLKQTKSSI